MWGVVKPISVAPSVKKLSFDIHVHLKIIYLTFY